MTTEEVLEQLRPDWALSRGEDYDTFQDGWVIVATMGQTIHIVKS